MRRFGFDSRTRRVIGSVSSTMAASASAKSVAMSSSVRSCSVGCAITSKCGESSDVAIDGNSAVRTTVYRMKPSTPLARQDPAEDEEKSSHREQLHLGADLAAAEAVHQPDRQKDHSGELQQTADESAHVRSVTAPPARWPARAPVF